ncbi:MAG TPA: hypothetical protein VIM55_03460 [Mucilaginibacter sp.]
MEEKEIQDQLTSIRSLMERSSKFISLNGLSGVLAGIYALIGAAIAYRIVYQGPTIIYADLSRAKYPESITQLFIVAMSVLILSLASGVILTKNKAKRKGQPIFGKISQSMLFHMAVPLVTGGLMILIFLYHGFYGIVGPASLIFYGLSLVGASNFTFTMVKYLGISEIILGLIAACLPGYGLLFWAIGFGVLHIVYGSVMYFKYDR